MSSYPGENPPPDDAQPTDAQPVHDAVQDGTEPTQPVGYWERQAAERAREQAQPTSPYPQNPYPQQNPYGPPGQQAYGGQPAAGYPPQQGQGQPGQAPPYYYPPAPGGPTGPPAYGYAAPPPAHPQATLALVLGLVGLVGAIFACGLTLVVSPFAWAVGRRAVKEIEASQGRLGGDSEARTGMITGIVGTVLLVLAIIALVGFFLLLFVAGTTSSTGSPI